MKKILTALLLAMLLISCKGGGETREDKPEGTMVKIGKENTIFINYPNWNVNTDKSKYPTVLEGMVKEYEKYGLDMALFGMTEDGMNGSQFVVEKAALDPAEYQSLIAKNITETATFIGESAVLDINGNEAIVWEFEMKTVNFRYLEAVFLVGEYNVRVQFWTAKDSFQEMYPEFMAIINSIVIE